jgi:hypothetical protein
MAQEKIDKRYFEDQSINLASMFQRQCPVSRTLRAHLAVSNERPSKVVPAARTISWTTSRLVGWKPV